MKILSIGNFSGPSWDGSITDENHIADALEELGHTVYRMQRERVSTGTLHDYAHGSVDFTLLAQWDGYTDLGDIPRPLIYWAFDYQNDGQEWHERLVAEADLYLSKRIADSKYPNWQWLSQDFSPKFLLDKSYRVEKDIDVLFTGSYLDWATERNDTLRAVNEKFNLVIHSVNAWPEEFKDVRLPIMDEGLPNLYARARVIISIDHTIERGYWSDRNFQIIACGQKPLFRYVPLSESTFHDLVEYFYNIEDCLQKIEKRLKYPALMQGQGHAYNSLERRVKDLITIVESIL